MWAGFATEHAKEDRSVRIFKGVFDLAAVFVNGRKSGAAKGQAIGQLS